MLLLIGGNLQAQDYCKQVKKEITNLTTYSYTSPYDTTGIPPVKITRSYSLDTDLAFDNFVIALQIVSELQGFFAKNPGGTGENDAKKMVIEFDDKSQITDDAIIINYEIMNEEQQVVRSVFLNLEDANLEKFSSKNITKYSFGGVEKTLTVDSATAYKNYVLCMKNAHKKVE